MPKTKQELQLEYTQLCAQLGEIELRRSSAQDAIKDMNDQRNTITQKVRNLQKAFQLLEAKETSPTPTEAPVEAPSAPEEASNAQG